MTVVTIQALITPFLGIILFLMMVLIMVVFDHRHVQKLSKINGEEMKIWNSKNKLTATDDLINFVFMKLYEDPDAWVGGKSYLNYKGSNTWVGYKKSSLGELWKSNIQIPISRKQRGKLRLAVENLMAAQALRSMMKVAVKNAT